MGEPQTDQAMTSGKSDHRAPWILQPSSSTGRLIVADNAVSFNIFCLTRRWWKESSSGETRRRPIWCVSDQDDQAEDCISECHVKKQAIISSGDGAEQHKKNVPIKKEANSGSQSCPITWKRASIFCHN